jgi:hypothetical protein
VELSGAMVVSTAGPTRSIWRSLSWRWSAVDGGRWFLECVQWCILKVCQTSWYFQFVVGRLGEASSFRWCVLVVWG